MCWLAEQAISCTVAGRNYWWIAPTIPVAKIAFGRLKRGLPRDIYHTNETERTITLLNGAVIWFKGAENPDFLYGEDVYAAVIDEASRVKEASWHAVRSTLTATRGPIRIIGNVKGRKNWAYQLARKAEAGAADMHYSKLTAYDAVAAGVLVQDEIDDAQRTLPDAVFRELYLAEPSDDGGNPFGIADIGACAAPLSVGKPVAWGIDLAKSLDWTVCIGLDAAGAVCRFERWQSPWQETLRRIRHMVGSRPALVDSTGVGDPILEALQEGHPNYEGYKFSAPSKQQLMEGLAVGIQQRHISYPPGAIVSELESFEYEYTRTGVRYTASEGMHDDCVCALALAWCLWQRSAEAAVEGVSMATTRERISPYEQFQRFSLTVQEAQGRSEERVRREAEGEPEEGDDDEVAVAVAGQGTNNPHDRIRRMLYNR